MLRGVFPVLLIPFDANGQIDEASLRRLIRFELEGGASGLGVGGFASEAYKLSEAERERCAQITAEETAGAVPLIIGLAPGSTEMALQQARAYARYAPAALMTLPPATMRYGEAALSAHYVALAEAAPAPVMLQYSPHIPGYSSAELSDDALADMAERAANLRYFKIEGPGSAGRIAALKARLGERAGLFGGVGGLAVSDEWQAGAAGLLPGCGFNEHFVKAWQSWEAGDTGGALAALRAIQPLVDAVSGHGHEFSIHARKYLLHRKGIIATTYARRPTAAVDSAALAAIGQLADGLGLRVAL